MRHLFPHIFGAAAFFLSISTCDAQSALRNDDGSLSAEAQMTRALCGKFWKYDEGHMSRRAYASTAFTLQYHADGTFCFNQRNEKNYWKLNGKLLLHSIAPFGKTAVNPYGIFEGEIEIVSVSDSVLVLKRIGSGKSSKKNGKLQTNNGRQDSVFRFLREEIKPKENIFSGIVPSNHRTVTPAPDGATTNELTLNQPAATVKKTECNKSAEAKTQPDCIVNKTLIMRGDTKLSLEKKEFAGGGIRFYLNGKEISSGTYHKYLVGDTSAEKE